MFLHVPDAEDDHAKKVIEQGVPELAKAVDDGWMAVSTAAIVATEPEEVQRQEAAEAVKRNRNYGTKPSRLVKKKPDKKPRKPGGFLKTNSVESLPEFFWNQLRTFGKHQTVVFSRPRLIEMMENLTEQSPVASEAIEGVCDRFGLVLSYGQDKSQVTQVGDLSLDHSRPVHFSQLWVW